MTAFSLAEQASSFMNVSLPWSMEHPLRTSGAPAMATQRSQKQSKRLRWPRMTKPFTAEAHLQSSNFKLCCQTLFLLCANSQMSSEPR